MLNRNPMKNGLNEKNQYTRDYQGKLNTQIIMEIKQFVLVNTRKYIPLIINQAKGKLCLKKKKRKKLIYSFSKILYHIKSI